jgi:squalene-hopene/tetraprenyl-beta-curcumene cyclase
MQRRRLGCFDINNDQDWLNAVPYGDLKAMIDPSTADITARVLEMHGRLSEDPEVVKGYEGN